MRNIDARTGEPLGSDARITDGSGAQWEKTRVKWVTVRPDGKLKPLTWNQLVAERGPITFDLGD